MLSGPFLSNYVLLLSVHHLHFTPYLPRCARSTERVYHLSVVYGGHGISSLAFASGKGYLKTVNFLVTRRGADVHAGGDKALMWASRKGHLEVVKFLVSRGANVRAASDDGALIYASEDGHLDMVKYLVSQGANVHAKYGEALRRASKNGHSVVFKFLSQVMRNDGADIQTTLRFKYKS